MGRLLYGPQQRAIEIDDRALAHLKVVMLTKLRRGESFAYSWDNDTEVGSGRGTIWIDRAIPLEFAFFGGRRPALNRTWIMEMNTSAIGGELRILPEPAENPEENAPSNRTRF